MQITVKDVYKIEASQMRNGEYRLDLDRNVSICLSLGMMQEVYVASRELLEKLGALPCCEPVAAREGA